MELKLALCNFKHGVNIGTAIRSAEAFGIKDIVIIGKKEFNERACSGANTKVNIVYVNNPEDFVEYCVERKLNIVSIDNRVKYPTISLEKAEFAPNTILVAGSENDGVDDEILKNSKMIIEIPLVGEIPCLNTAVACSVVLWEYSRRRNYNGA